MNQDRKGSPKTGNSLEKKSKPKDEGKVKPIQKGNKRIIHWNLLTNTFEFVSAFVNWSRQKGKVGEEEIC